MPKPGLIENYWMDEAMHKNVEDHELSRGQLCYLAHHTCQWWNAVFIQAKRFITVFEQNCGSEPWDADGDEMAFLPERMFLITAINHALEYTQKLNIELQRSQNFTLQNVLDEVFSSISKEDIKNLRDMNEHSLDYLVGEGHHQNQFISRVEKENIRIETSAAVTFLHGDVKLFLLGNVPIDKLLLIMKKQQPIVKEITREIFYKNWG